MGKTSVALAVAHDRDMVRTFGTRRYWIPCDQTPTIPLLVEHLARGLLLTGQSADRLAQVVAHLNAHSEPHLFVFDNFETLWDPEASKQHAEDVLIHLGSVSRTTILLTTRGTVPPGRIQWSPLPPIDLLPLDAARATLKAITNDAEVDEQELDTLLRALDCYALAVTLVAQVSQTGFSPSELLQAWKKQQTAVLDVGQGRLSSVDFSIRLSLQSRPMLANPSSFS
jgi:hypothetical protein